MSLVCHDRTAVRDSAQEFVPEPVKLTMPAPRASREPETDRAAARRGPLRRRGLQVEWPTLAVAAAIYGGFGLVTWFHAALPW